MFAHLAPLSAAILFVVAAFAEPPRPAQFAWFAEGEACSDHDWDGPIVGNKDYEGCYSGAHLMCAKDADPENGAFEARFTIDLADAGEYAIWVAATRPGVASPLRVSVDAAEPTAISGEIYEGMWGPSSVFSWMPAARVGLAAGAHTLSIGVAGRRDYDSKYYAYLDAVALERVGDNAAQSFSAWPRMPEIRDTPIRFYSGNLSVGWFMQYWGTGQPGNTGAIDRPMIDLLHRCGCTAMCDYLAWCHIQEEPGRWDWSFYRENARKLHAAGIQYNTFAWLHFPPKWFMESDDWVPYRCLEHGTELKQLSLWAPFTLRLYDEFYRRLAADLGETVDFIRLAMPSEYGEIGYPIGMTNWLVPQDHVHGGYWCGDDFALRDFRAKMQARFNSLDALNARWGTDFATWEAVAPPQSPNECAARALETRSPADRRRWLDFVDWYQDAWGEFAHAATNAVRKHLPDREVIISLGYGAEPVAWGNDQSRHIKRISQANAAAQTPGDIGYFATRRVSTACRVYGVPYFTEPPGNVDRERQVRRLFYDISNGTQTWFDYPQNLDGARDILAANLDHLNGQPPVCDVAFLMPSSWWWCHPTMHWPDRTIRFAEGLRDRMDYEVLDELLVRDGGLQRLGNRVLVLCEGHFMQAETLSALVDWVSGGGVLALMGVDRLEDIDGSVAVFESLCPASAPSGSDVKACWDSGRKVGAGRVIFLSGATNETMPGQQAVVLELAYHLSGLDPSRTDAPAIDEQADGVLATLFADRALFYNGTEKRVSKSVAVPGPEGPRRVTLDIPARSIAAALTETP